MSKPNCCIHPERSTACAYCGSPDQYPREGGETRITGAQPVPKGEKEDTPEKFAKLHRLIELQALAEDGLLVTYNKESKFTFEQVCKLMAELGLEVDSEWRAWGIVEIAVRNSQVAEYCEHWEGRAEKAEGELRLIDAVLERRPALADLNDRYLKVERACSIAGRAESAESRLAEAEKARDEAKAEATACLRFMSNALQWEGFRGEFLAASDEEKRNAHERNVQSLQNFLAKTGHAKGMLEELEAAEKKLAELSAIVEPLRELWDKRTNVTDFYDCEAANEGYEEAALNSVSRLLALVPPVEKGEK